MGLEAYKYTSLLANISDSQFKEHKKKDESLDYCESFRGKFTLLHFKEKNMLVLNY